MAQRSLTRGSACSGTGLPSDRPPTIIEFMQIPDGLAFKKQLA
jgi:hypothetical protein